MKKRIILAILIVLGLASDMGRVYQDCPGEPTDGELEYCVSGWISWID